MIKLPLLSILLLLSSAAVAQRIATVEGEYVYHVPENVSDEEARRVGLYRAQLVAIANEFGTLVSQNATTVTENRQGQSSVDFFAVGGSDVRGEWLETLGSPTYKFSYEGDFRVLRVWVKGKAREIVASLTECDLHVLRNGTDNRFESTDFVDGDMLYVSFRSPMDGYLCLFLLDENDHNCYALLPDPDDSSNGSYHVKGNEQYVFFSSGHMEGKQPYPCDVYLNCANSRVENNVLYVVFSPNKFVRPVASFGSSIKDNGDTLPGSVTFRSFTKWLNAARSRDKDMICKQISITIKKKNEQ